VPARKPLIGVTSSELFAFGPKPPNRVAVARPYLEAVEQAGGVPMMLSPTTPLNDLVGLLDGLLIPGGPDVQPALYGEDEHQANSTVDPQLEEFELGILHAARSAGLPTLAVCRGMQLLWVSHGGRLIQHLPDTDSPIAHSVGQHPDPRHEVLLSSGSRLAAIAGGEQTLQVNSFHHQACRGRVSGLTVTAYAPDGIIEAVEDPRHPFLIGVQWHPETMLHQSEQRALFDALIDAAR